MTPGIADYKSYVRGDTINERRFTITQTIDAIESPVDLTGATIKADFIGRPGLNKKTMRIGDGISIIDALNGIFKIDSFSLATAGTWEYDVEIEFPDGTVKTWVTGTITILENELFCKYFN
jgi:hypothetical protein